MELENSGFVISGPKKNMDIKCEVHTGNEHNKSLKNYITV
jgi:hypothetical protein